MKRDIRLGLYLMTAKGVAVLKRLVADFGPDALAYVVTARDETTEYDGHEDILRLAREAGIPAFVRPDAPEPSVNYLLAVSWRWLIRQAPGQQLVIFHDSLLPRYRGFAPLLSALINGDRELGVTAFYASEEYDRGPIIAQEAVSVRYPITLAEAIDLIVPCYEKLAADTVGKLFRDEVETQVQDESKASYSLWRDEQDYFVDWTWDAARIRRFVDALGYPYKGAAVTVGGLLCRIRACEEVADVVIENRDCGKVIFLQDDKPVVVCGKGLLRILRLTEDGTGRDMLPLPKFRLRLMGGPRRT